MEQTTEKQEAAKNKYKYAKGLILRIVIGAAVPAALFIALRAVLGMNNIEEPRWFVPECIYAGALFFYSIVSMYLGFPYKIVPPKRDTSETDPRKKPIGNIRPRYSPRSNKYYVDFDGEHFLFDKEPTQEEIEERIRYGFPSYKNREYEPEKGKNISIMPVIIVFLLFSWSSVLFSVKYIDAMVIEHTYPSARATVSDITSELKEVPRTGGRTKSSKELIKVYKMDYEYELNGQQYYGVFKSERKYEKGTRMTVYADPSDLSESYAEPELSDSPLYIIAGTLFMIIFFKVLIYACMSIELKPKPKPSDGIDPVLR